MDDDKAPDDYELLPQKEIDELKTELRRLKEFEFAPAKKMQVSVVELNQKLDRLLSIFDEALHSFKADEGGLTFADKMKPISDKLSRVLDQNASIAEGMVAVADMVSDLKKKLESVDESADESPVQVSSPPIPSYISSLPPLPSKLPPIPPPPRR